MTKMKSLEENDKRICELLTDSEKKIDEMRLQLGIINGTIIRTIHVSEPAPLVQIAPKRPRGRPPKKLEQQN